MSVVSIMEIKHIKKQWKYTRTSHTDDSSLLLQKGSIHAAERMKKSLPTFSRFRYTSLIDYTPTFHKIRNCENHDVL